MCIDFYHLYTVIKKYITDKFKKENSDKPHHETTDNSTAVEREVNGFVITDYTSWV